MGSLQRVYGESQVSFLGCPNGFGLCERGCWRGPNTGQFPLGIQSAANQLPYNGTAGTARSQTQSRPFQAEGGFRSSAGGTGLPWSS